jgi:hypothetical protein
MVVPASVSEQVGAAAGGDALDHIQNESRWRRFL